MKKQCDICHGNMAYYPILPDWAGKQASINQDGYFICPIDGTIKEAVKTLIPSSAIPDEHETYDETVTPERIKGARQKLVTMQLHPATVDAFMNEKRGIEALKFVEQATGSDAASQAIKAVEKATPKTTTGSADPKKLIPTTDNTYGDEVKDPESWRGVTEEHAHAVDKAREYVKNVDGTPGMTLIEAMPPVQRVEVLNNLANDHQVGYMNEVLQGARDSMGFENAASIQKEAMWYFLKPRWILRRKANAVIRRKVRSVFTPYGPRVS